MMNQADFNSLVRQKIASHEFHPICVKDKATKARRKKNDAARYNRLKDDPEWKAQRNERLRNRRHNDEYRKHHAEEMRRWRAKQSPEWKQKELERVRQYEPKARKKETKVYHGITVTNIKLTKEIKPCSK